MRPAGRGAGPPPRTCERWGAGGLRLLLVLLDVADRVADGLDVAQLVVGDRDAELVLDRGGDLDHRQRVDVQVIGEGLLRGGVGGRHTGDLLQDLGQTGLDLLGAAHFVSSLALVGCVRIAAVLIGSLASSLTRGGSSLSDGAGGAPPSPRAPWSRG